MREKHQLSAKRYTSGRGVTLEKLPPLQRGDKTVLSTSWSHSHLSTPGDRERMTAALKDWDPDCSLHNRWQIPDSFQRGYRSATTRLRMDSEKDSDIFTGKPEKDIIFPMKPTCHRRAFNLNNCQEASDRFQQKDPSKPDYLEMDLRKGKRAGNRRQGDIFDTEPHQPSWKRGETDGYQTIREGQYRRPANQMGLAKEIQRQEMILHEKLLKTGETLKKIQLRTRSGDKVKTEQRNGGMGKGDDRSYFTEKGKWDWERLRERTVVGRRDEGQRERFRDWGRGDRGDAERREKHAMETDEGYRKRRGGTERENRRRNTRTNERDSDEVRKPQKWETARAEKDRIKRERAKERGRDETHEWDRRDWQGRVDDGERRGERVRFERDRISDNEYQRDPWNLLDMLKPNSHVKAKASFRSDQSFGPAGDQQPAQARLQQHSQRAAAETFFRNGGPREPSPEAVAQSAHPNQTGARLRQVELSPERSVDAPVRLETCQICHRCFAEDRLERHAEVCEKLQQSKRKAFDSAQHRAKGTELEVFMKTNGQRSSPELKKNNWRQKHEALIHNLRQARVPAAAGLPPQPSADANPDYVRCPHCSRRFAPGPAERHIPKCQNIKSKPPPPPRHRH